ncbi:EamA family transporter [Streptomyces sp. SL13]|uniref:EamA family transporter n=1 Tax=Streptantibioticus silvisoli TaxID=2705255 RepID=A0AA90H6R1_9ACTN|nr:EamA family transporter [Streptantibioticus silvisoli]MDI5969815.1 EamA family transporter [Streptantibioticus silvisoli]
MTEVAATASESLPVTEPGTEASRGGKTGPAGWAGLVPAPFMVLAGMVSLQFGSAFAKQLFERTGPAGATLLRLLIAATLLCLFFRPTPRLLRAHWRLLLPYGVVLAVMQFSFYEATSRLPLGVVVTLEYTGPLLIALAGSRKALDVLWVLLAGTGLAVLGGGHVGTDPVGVLAALLTGTALTGYILLGSAVSRATSGGAGLATGMAVASVVALPGSFVLGLPPVGALLDPEVLAVAFAVAVLSTAVPFSLEFVVLRRMPPRVFAVLGALEPVIAVLVGLVVLGEALSVPQWAAVLCVVVAAVASNWGNRAGLPDPAPGAGSSAGESRSP